MDLLEALHRQIAFCAGHERYRCGIYTQNQERRKIVIEVLKEILFTDLIHKFNVHSYNAEIIFKNGSSIRIVQTGNSSRGYKFNGVVIDNDVERKIYDCLILPSLLPLCYEDGRFAENDNPKDRLYFVNISWDDVEEAVRREKCIRKFLNKIDLLPFQKEILMKKFHNNEKLFKKEYECMWSKNDYDMPVVTKELNNTKVMLYEAWGIPKENINYEREFVNKTKQTFINIRGSAEDIDLGFENQVNIHILINTNVYDGYEVIVTDGMVKVILHEIENTAPKLKDFGKAN